MTDKPNTTRGPHWINPVAGRTMPGFNAPPDGDLAPAPTPPSWLDTIALDAARAVDRESRYIHKGGDAQNLAAMQSIIAIALGRAVRQASAPADLDDVDLLDYCGADAAKWAKQFRLTALRLGYSDMDEGWLIGWFANAIERAEQVRHTHFAAPTPPAAEAPGQDPVAACEVLTMHTSSGFPDHFARVTVGDRSLDFFMSRIKGQAEYHAAELDWLLNGAEKPDILGFDYTEPQGLADYLSARAAPPTYADTAPARGWLSIETAPQDRPCHVFNVVTGPYTSQLTDGEWPLGFWNGSFGRWFPRPTHWREIEAPTYADAEAKKSDRQIVEEVNDLARTMLRFHSTGYEAPEGHKFYAAKDTRSRKAWQGAVEVYEQITGSEVHDALQCLDDEPTAIRSLASPAKEPGQ